MDNTISNDITNESIWTYGKAMAKVECQIDTASKNGIGKLLSVTGKVVNATVEGEGESVKVFATLNCKVIYLDHEGGYDSSDYLSDFNVAVPRQESRDIVNLWADCAVMDLDSNVKGDIVTVQCMSNIVVRGTASQITTCASNIEEDILVKSERVITQECHPIRESFTIDEDYESGTTIEKILFFDVDGVVNNAKANSGGALVSGEIVATVVYQSEGDITTKTFNIPFAQDMAVEGMCETDKLDVDIEVRDSKIILSGVEGENMLSLTIELAVVGLQIITSERNVALDMFSPYNKLELEYEENSYNDFVCQRTLSDKITGSASLQENLPPATKILSTVISREILANTYVDNGNIVLEGLLACNVIYLDADEDTHSVLVELPYSLQFDSEGAGEDMDFSGHIIVGQLYAKIKRDREIEVTAMLNIHLTENKKCVLKCVSKYTKGEQTQCNDYAMSVYICGAEDDLWAVAKKLNAPIESISAQNGGIQKVQPGMRVFYYRGAKG